ncbi:MAG: 5-(carboxyamino)imidazole ribonucleotide mutase [Oscillospiraceae bacterium]|jgi:5-(carboxyamino)imidazole ribonucleotide mutase|nr:5-(carboxyamino)imidazole ribonucleotide mutase [Oscillospiraceae bacterium]
MLKAAVIMGSKSDLETVKPAIDALERFGVPHTVHVISAHRTPDLAAQFARSAKAEGYGVLICAAGKAAHLGGVMAAYTTLPVIGLPIKSSLMDGLDSLLSIVQMPTGVPVATVAVNGSENAAILAVQILALSEPALADKLAEHKKALADAIIAVEL